MLKHSTIIRYITTSIQILVKVQEPKWSRAWGCLWKNSTTGPKHSCFFQPVRSETKTNHKYSWLTNVFPRLAPVALCFPRLAPVALFPRFALRSCMVLLRVLIGLFDPILGDYMKFCPPDEFTFGFSFGFLESFEKSCSF